MGRQEPVIQPVKIPGSAARVAGVGDAKRAAIRRYGDRDVSGNARCGARIADAPELQAARRFLRLGPASRVLLINTEGATDPVGYRRVVGEL